MGYVMRYHKQQLQLLAILFRDIQLRIHFHVPIDGTKCNMVIILTNSARCVRAHITQALC